MNYTLFLLLVLMSNAKGRSWEKVKIWNFFLTVIQSALFSLNFQSLFQCTYFAFVVTSFQFIHTISVWRLEKRPSRGKGTFFSNAIFLRLKFILKLNRKMSTNKSEKHTQRMLTLKTVVTVNLSMKHSLTLLERHKQKMHKNKFFYNLWV